MWLKTYAFVWLDNSFNGDCRNICVARIVVCQSSNLLLTMSYSGAYNRQVGIGSHSRTTGTSGIRSLGNSPGQYIMQASARATGSYPFHRPGVTHLETPATATAIRYGSGAQSSSRSSERSDSRGRERRRSRNSRLVSRSVSASGITECPPNVGTTDAVVRIMPSGPEDTQYWNDALDRVADNMTTHERHQRTVAQAMAAYQERLAVLELKLEEAVAYGEKRRSYLSEACGNMLTKFVKVEDMTQRDETHREDMSSLQIGVHHNLHGQSTLVARVEALETQIQN